MPPDLTCGHVCRRSPTRAVPEARSSSLPRRGAYAPCSAAARPWSLDRRDVSELTPANEAARQRPCDRPGRRAPNAGRSPPSRDSELADDGEQAELVERRSAMAPFYTPSVGLKATRSTTFLRKR